MVSTPRSIGQDAQQLLEEYQDFRWPKVDVELTVDTYTLPCVYWYGMAEKRAFGWPQCCTLAAFCLLSVLVVWVQIYVLYVVIRKDIWGLMHYVSDSVNYFQYGALIIVFLSLVADVRGAQALGRIYRTPGSDKRDFINVTFGTIQQIITVFVAYASATFIFAQPTRSDVVLGSFTLTFVVNLDELIMSGILKIIQWKDGDLMMDVPLTWNLKSRPEPKVNNLMKKFKTHAPVALLLNYMMAAADGNNSIQFFQTAESCAAKVANTSRIASKHFCEHAARSLGLEDTKASGNGTCMWNHMENRLWLGDPAEYKTHPDITFLCQPDYVYVRTSGPMLLFEPPEKLCPYHKMIDVQDRDECKRVVSSLNMKTLEEVNERKDVDFSYALPWYDSKSIGTCLASGNYVYGAVCRMP